ncbi:MAG: DegT/DnrJ/EryC1/StrS aminotransferase family protein, partial [Deltaproteobacteria bacterium]|nr:DegT/DnrJ/EryC1/StrS aminotransferase family protein [Deltaproteobacteria bacterium]
KNLKLKPLKSILTFSPPYVGDEELEELRDTLSSGWLTAGPKTKRFEEALAKRLGCPEALALSSCTAALHLGLKIMGLNEDQAAITSPLSFVSTCHALLYNGARPFFADVSADTGNLDPDKVREFLESQCEINKFGRAIHKKTSLKITALLPVHYGGHPCDLEGLWRICQQYNLGMLEDAAHAMGTTFKDLPVGHPKQKPNTAEPLPSMVAFSFYATKNLAAGEGGALVGLPAFLKRARVLSAYGISDARRIWERYSKKGTWRYDVEELGYKYNFTDIQASLALAQLAKFDEMARMRKERVKIWNSFLAPLAGNLVELPVERAGCGHAWHLYPLKIKKKALLVDRNQIIDDLRALRIGTSVMFTPIHYFKFYRSKLHYRPHSFPIAEDFALREISLPISPAHSLKDIEQAAELTKNYLESRAK